VTDENLADVQGKRDHQETESSSNRKSNTTRFLERFNINSTSLVLVIVTLLVCYASIILFYATQLHTRVSEIKLNGTPLNIWRAQEFVTQYDDWKSRLDIQKTALLGYRINQDTAGRAAANSDLKFNEATDTIKRDIIKAAIALGEASYSVKNEDIEVDYFTISAKLDDRIQKDAENGDNFKILGVNLKNIGDVYFNLLKNNQETHAASAAAKSDVDNAELIENGIEAEETRLFGVSSTNLPPELIEEINDTILEIKIGSEGGGLRGNPFLAWPTDNIVLLLVVVMGILGSCLHLMADHFGEATAAPGNDRQQLVTPSQTLLRIFYGGIMALVVYLVAKASVPIVTDTSRVGGQAPLNPYFISFVGIISGLASERAIRSLQGVGESVFASGGKVDLTPRYATPLLIKLLAEKLKDPKALEMLATYLSMDTGETSDAAAGRRALMPQEQSIVAAFAGADLREGFSDLPPATVDKAAPEGHPEDTKTT
jgi:hypothetical protein